MPPRISTLILEDFSGGLNLRDAPSQVGNNESPDCMNVSLDERGGVVKRLGLERLGSGTSISAAPSNLFYSAAQNVFIVQDGAAVKKTTDFINFTTIKTYTTSERACFADFVGNLIAVHPTDRVSYWDGATWTDVGATSPKGSAIVVWQNRALVVGDPANKARLYACKAGTIGTWTTGAGDGWTNDIREKDDETLTALAVGQGMDVQGRPSLLVFKERSTYRVHDSSTGAYTTLHREAGAGGPLAVASTQGIVAFMGPSGVYVTDGVEQPREASGKIAPIFRPTQINMAQASLWAAGVKNDRIVFSFTWGSGQSTNNRTLEYDPQQGWFVIHDFGCAAYTQ